MVLEAVRSRVVGPDSRSSRAWRARACMRPLCCGCYVAFGCALLCCSSVACMWVLLACTCTRCMLMYEIKKEDDTGGKFVHA
jgi:hypothetical protein